MITHILSIQDSVFYGGRHSQYYFELKTEAYFLKVNRQ